MKKYAFYTFVICLFINCNSLYAIKKCKYQICSAIISGNSERVETILKRNKKAIHSKERYNVSLLQITIQQSDKQIFDLLIKYGASVTSKDAGGASALHTAVRYGFIHAIEKILLVDHSVINLQDNEGYTPFMRAISLGRSAAVITMLQYKPDCNIRNKEGKTIKEIINYKLSREAMSDLSEYISSCQ